MRGEREELQLELRYQNGLCNWMLPKNLLNELGEAWADPARDDARFQAMRKRLEKCIVVKE